MAIITIPTSLPFVRRTWVPPAQNQVNRSEWTGARKVVRLPGAGRWTVSAALKPTSKELEAWPWKAFFAALEGEANTFLMPYCNGPQWHEPFGSGLVCDGVVAQGASGMRVRGLQVGNPGLRMYAGQALSILLPSGKTQLIILTSDMVAFDDSGAGKADITFRGTLREQIGDGTAIEADNPVCEMAMASSSTPVRSEQGVYEFAFDAEEAF